MSTIDHQLARRRIHDVVRAAQGGRRLAFGALFAGAGIIAGNLVQAFVIADRFPPGAGPWPGWVAFAAVYAAVAISIVRVDGLINDWMFVIVLAGAGIAAALDIRATWGLLHVGVHPTVAPAVGSLLMVVIAARHVLWPVLAVSALTTALLWEALAQLATAGPSVVYGIVTAGLGLLPPVLAILAVQRFRRVVERELSLAEARTTARREQTMLTVAASEELAQLDLEAERLLDRVAWGRDLDDETAERAAEIAAALRRRLIEGRNETWLKLAVEQSPYLSAVTTVDDPSAMAGALGHDQRDGLLVGIWMLSTRARRFGVPVTVRVGFEPALADHAVVLEVTGLQLRDLDSTVWDSLHRVGDVAAIVGPAGFTLLITAPAPEDRHRDAADLAPARRARHDAHALAQSQPPAPQPKSQSQPTPASRRGAHR